MTKTPMTDADKIKIEAYETYAWVFVDPTDGKVGLVAGLVGDTMMPLLNRNEDLVRHSFRQFAQLHADKTGQPIAMVKFSNPEIVEILG